MRPAFGKRALKVMYFMQALDAPRQAGNTKVAVLLEEASAEQNEPREGGGRRVARVVQDNVYHAALGVGENLFLERVNVAA